jgi:hypothetical protein
MNFAAKRFLYAPLGLSLLVTAQAISTDSPFVPKNGQPVMAASENTPIELRGIASGPDGLSFGIYEPATQKGDWVKQGAADAAYVVRSYDEANNAVTVEYQGRVQTLTLKEARFDGTAAIIPMVQAPHAMPGPQNQMMRPPTPGMPGAPAIAAAPADEAARLQQVANEVKRRRAARAAATQAANPNPPPPGGP